MANSHENTKHTRLPIRTATRAELLAKKLGVTKATAHDMVIEDFLLRHGHDDIIAETADLPEPRRALPPAAALAGT